MTVANLRKEAARLKGVLEKRQAVQPPLPPTPEAAPAGTSDPFGDWLRVVSPTWNWAWPHLAYIREKLARVTAGECRKLMLFLPPRHSKSEMSTIRYPVWR